MRIALLIVAAVTLIGFVVVAVVVPQRSAADSKEAAQALVSGADAAQKQVAANAEKAGSLEASGKDVKIAGRNDPKHGELKWIVSENGAIRGWNEKNALEIALTPSLSGGKASWTCRGYPVTAMPPSCAGR